MGLIFRKMSGRFMLTCILAMAAYQNSWSAAACCGAGGGGGGVFASSALTAAQGAANDFDTLKAFFNVNAFLGASWALNGHAGDPLGTGGRQSAFYNSNLYLANVPALPGNIRTDLRVQYADFGYIPLWPPNSLSAFLKYRLSEDLVARIGLNYGGEIGKPGVNANGQLALGEVSLRWRTPMDGLSIKAGNIVDVESYSPIFDQSPLDNYIYAGLLGRYDREFAGNKLAATLGVGNSFLNNAFTHGVLPEAGMSYAVRQRSYLYFKPSFSLGKSVTMKLLGGLQFVPGDSTYVGSTSRYLREGNGAHLGLQTDLQHEKLNGSIAVNHLAGDVVLGSGAPDFVRMVSGDSISGIRDEFSRDGSSLTNVVVWGGYTGKKSGLQGGVWYMMRNPARSTVVEVNPNYALVQVQRLNNDTLIIPDDLPQDSLVTLSTEPFSAVKFAIQPSFKPLDNLTIGARVDYIRYLTPNAHSNAQEPAVDEAMRPRRVPSDSVDRIWSTRSRWDREAVNALVISPMLSVDFKEYGSFSATYSIGMYDKEILRHGTIAPLHQNFSLGATINLVVKKSAKPAAVECATHGAVSSGEVPMSQKTCPVMGNAVVRTLYTDVDGHRIYVCCPACIEIIRADPQKHIAILRERGEGVETIPPVPAQ